MYGSYAHQFKVAATAADAGPAFSGMVEYPDGVSRVSSLALAVDLETIR
jgi:hypothetical protein